MCSEVKMSGGLTLKSCGPAPPVDTSGPNFGSAKNKATKSKVAGSDIQNKAECRNLVKDCDFENKEQPTSFHSERQQKIFEHLVNMYPGDLFDCAYVCSDDFRKMADDLTGPVGVNLVNSPKDRRPAGNAGSENAGCR